MSDLIAERKCSGCDSANTSLTKKGYPKWYRNLPSQLFLCELCYKHLIDNPRYRESLKIKNNNYDNKNGRRPVLNKPTAQDTIDDEGNNSPRPRSILLLP